MLDDRGQLIFLGISVVVVIASYLIVGKEWLRVPRDDDS
jgi:hypothetical protein